METETQEIFIIENANPSSLLDRIFYYLRSAVGIVVIFILTLFSNHWLLPFSFFLFLLLYFLRAVIWARWDIIRIAIERESLHIHYEDFMHRKQMVLGRDDVRVSLSNAFAKGDVHKLELRFSNFKIVQYESKFWTKDRMDLIVSEVSKLKLS